MFKAFTRAYRALRSQCIRLVETLTPSEKIFFYTFLGVALVATLIGTYKINQSLLIDVPRSGGSLTEGFIGTPRFINPVLATSDTDKDLVSLVYSGLVRQESGGGIFLDLASSWSVSEDGKEYFFTIRENAEFHDGTSVTASDVIFTIQKIQDPVLKSPKRPAWEGIEVVALSDREIKFTLKQPYGAFLNSLSLGIMPKYIWNEISSDEMPYSAYNTNPIGSGPYKVDRVIMNPNGLPEEIELHSFSKFVLNEPYIKKIFAKFYINRKDRVDALLRKEINSVAGLTDENAVDLSEEGFIVKNSPLNRIFGLFLNQNSAPVLAHKEIRKALSDATDRRMLVKNILKDFGSPQTSPIPEFALEEQEGLVPIENPLENSTTTTPGNSAEEILARLNALGWKIGEDGILFKGTEKLAFSISTSDSEDLKETALSLQEMWKKIGAEVSIKIFEPSQLNLSVIRPRNYQSLLFGITIGREKDYYAFWHSSQRNDPGLNISLYTNAKADKLLESVRTLNNTIERALAERSFALMVETDTPAIFLYSPHFIYVAPSRLKGYNNESLRAPGDRFYDIHTWYIETDSVWGIFATN